MSEVRVGKNESLDSALRRFKRPARNQALWPKFVSMSIMKKPSVKRKKKAEAARKRK